MSSYAALTDLATLGLPSGVLTGITTADQQRALDAASTLADGYLRSKFTLPITTPSVDLIEAVCKIASYALMSVRGYNPETGSDTNIRDRYLDAVKWLKGVSDGSITPALTDSSSAGKTGGPFVTYPVTSTTQLDANGNPMLTTGAASARGW